jgi:hypothetical protein
MPTPLRLSAACLLLGLLSGCSSTLTLTNYSRIKMGLGYPEVVEILGKPDGCSAALVARSCIWGDEQTNITISFVGEKVGFYSSKNIK